MRPTRQRPITLIAAVLAAGACAVSAAGCGSSSVSGTIDPIAKAATVSNSAAGYAMKFTMQMSSSALPSAINATGTGSFNSGSRTGQVNMAMDLGSIPGAAQLFGGSTLNMQEVLDHETVYIKMPAALMSALGKQLGGSAKPWLSINLAKAGSAAGIPGLGSLMSNPASSNPAQMLQYLKAVSGNVTKVGSENVNGVDTTHYRATLDLTKYPSLVPASQRAAVQQAIAALQKLAKLKSFPVDVWVDGNHLVRRMRFAFNEQLASAGGQSLRMQMTLDMTGYGAQPAPSIPSADQVTDLTSLVGAAGLGGTTTG